MSGSPFALCYLPKTFLFVQRDFVKFGCKVTQVDRLAEGVETHAIIGWNCYPRPKGRGYSPDL